MILEGVRPARLLLDTCAVIYLFNGDVMLADAVEAIDNAGAILVSPVSAWEIGILGQKRLSSTPEFSPDPAAWFRAVLTSPKTSRHVSTQRSRWRHAPCPPPCTATRRIAS